MVKDPVCEIEVDEKTTPYKTVYANNIYYFTSAECQKKFNENPEKYMTASVMRHAAHYGGYCPTRPTLP